MKTRWSILLGILAAIVTTAWVMYADSGDRVTAGDRALRHVAAPDAILQHARTVYLRSEPSGGVLPPAALRHGLDASVVDRWSPVRDAIEADRIDALLLDPGSVEVVDWPLVADAMQDGMALVGINVPVDDLVARSYPHYRSHEVRDVAAAGGYGFSADRTPASGAGELEEYWSVVAAPSTSCGSVGEHETGFTQSGDIVRREPVTVGSALSSALWNCGGREFVPAWDLTFGSSH